MREVPEEDVNKLARAIFGFPNPGIMSRISAREILKRVDSVINGLVEVGRLERGVDSWMGTNGPAWFKVVRQQLPCRHCGEPVEPWDFTMEKGSWRHIDGNRQCGTLAAPIEGESKLPNDFKI